MCTLVVWVLVEPLGRSSCDRISTVAVKGALGTGVTKMPGTMVWTPR